MDDTGGAGFVIRASGLHFMVAGGCHLYAPFIPAAELRGA